jgi:hypothetical protein
MKSRFPIDKFTTLGLDPRVVQFPAQLAEGRFISAGRMDILRADFIDRLKPARI